MQGRGARKRSSLDYWRQKREEEEQEDKEERCYVTRRTYGRYGLFKRRTTREFEQTTSNCQERHTTGDEENVRDREEEIQQERGQDREDQGSHPGIQGQTAEEDHGSCPGAAQHDQSRGSSPDACRAKRAGPAGATAGTQGPNSRIRGRQEGLESAGTGSTGGTQGEGETDPRGHRRVRRPIRVMGLHRRNIQDNKDNTRTIDKENHQETIRIWIQETIATEGETIRI